METFLYIGTIVTSVMGQALYTLLNITLLLEKWLKCLLPNSPFHSLIKTEYERLQRVWYSILKKIFGKRIAPDIIKNHLLEFCYS